MSHLSVFPVFADVTVSNGSGLLHQGWVFLVVGICVAVLWWVGKWCIGAMGLPAGAFKVWNGLFIIVGALLLTNFLLSLIGHPIVQL